MLGVLALPSAVLNLRSLVASPLFVVSGQGYPETTNNVTYWCDSMFDLYDMFTDPFSGRLFGEPSEVGISTSYVITASWKAVYVGAMKF